MARQEIKPFPRSLHIVTYDVKGVVRDTGASKKTRQSGIVEHTHHLIEGLGRINSDTRMSITHTGTNEASGYDLITPDLQTVFVQGVQTRFPKYLRDPITGGKDKERTKYYYEDEIRNPENPVYKSLADQYAKVIRRANTPNLLLQNPNPIVGILKAEELGLLDSLTCGQLNVTGVIHDTQEYPARIAYIKDRFGKTRMNLKLITISQAIYDRLIAEGFSPESLYKISNGIDINAFDRAVIRTREEDVFSTVKKRNGLPNGKMVLLSARRVEHKGHKDIVKAAGILRDSRQLDDVFFAFTGEKMLDIKSLNYENEIKKLISSMGLDQKVFLLDQLSMDEVVASYLNASASVLPSTEPEGFAYANIESMLAGTPVITTRMGGPLDYIKHGETGLFVRPNNPMDIALAISDLLNNPSLARDLSKKGRQRAEEYSLDKMASGYLEAIRAGKTAYSANINPGRPFEWIGEGMHTDAYDHVSRNGERKYLIQTFKKNRQDLTLASVKEDYDYLTTTYKEMPSLIPRQRLVMPAGATDLRDMLLVKRRVHSDSKKNTLLKVTPEELEEKTRRQLAQFIEITKEVFRDSSQANPSGYSDPKVPDIIDPQFENLLIDSNGDLKLVDTNRLISIKKLVTLKDADSKLDIANKKIHARLLQRLMYIDSKFFGRSREQIMSDPFYNQLIAQGDFEVIFEKNEAIEEPIS